MDLRPSGSKRQPKRTDKAAAVEEERIEKEAQKKAREAAKRKSSKKRKTTPKSAPASKKQGSTQKKKNDQTPPSSFTPNPTSTPPIPSTTIEESPTSTPPLPPLPSSPQDNVPLPPIAQVGCGITPAIWNTFSYEQKKALATQFGCRTIGHFEEDVLKLATAILESDETAPPPPPATESDEAIAEIIGGQTSSTLVSSANTTPTNTAETSEATNNGKSTETDSSEPEQPPTGKSWPDDVKNNPMAKPHKDGSAVDCLCCWGKGRTKGVIKARHPYIPGSWYDHETTRGHINALANVTAEKEVKKLKDLKQKAMANFYPAVKKKPRKGPLYDK